MTRYVINTIIVLILSALLAKAQDPKGRPNIIFIIANDVSDDDIGCYGNRQVRTPNIDRIAREGMRFTNAYLTASSCSPIVV